MNDLVDRLAVEAATTQRSRSGEGEPGDLGPADDVSGSVRANAAAAASSLAVPAVEGHGLVVLGHRPTELGGYDANPLTDAVRGRVAEVVAAKAQMHGDLVVVSGLRLGAEMMGAEVAIELDVPLVAVLPYPDPDSVWPAESRARFRALIDGARDVLLLQKKAPESKQKAGAALARRDAWLVRNVDEALLVWDGVDAGLGKLFRSLEDRLGDDVWVIDPGDLV